MAETKPDKPDKVTVTYQDAPNNWPTRKVTYQTIGGAVAALVLGTVRIVYPDIQFPAGYESGLAIVIGAVIGYFTMDRLP